MFYADAFLGDVFRRRWICSKISAIFSVDTRSSNLLVCPHYANQYIHEDGRIPCCSHPVRLRGNIIKPSLAFPVNGR